jgi:hypothetical protein
MIEGTFNVSVTFPYAIHIISYPVGKCKPGLIRNYPVMVDIVNVIASPPRAGEAIRINLRDCHVVPMKSGLLAMTVETARCNRTFDNNWRIKGLIYSGIEG